MTEATLSDTEYDELIKASLTDDPTWELATATPEMIKRAEGWLADTILRIDNQLAGRRAHVEDIRRESPGTGLFREVEAEHRAWRRRAVSFRRLVDRRYKMVRTLATKTDAIVRAQQHAQRMGEQKEHTSRSMLALATAVEAFTRGGVSAEYLDGLLDQITVPHAESSTQTLREVLDARRAADDARRSSRAIA